MQKAKAATDIRQHQSCASHSCDCMEAPVLVVEPSQRPPGSAAHPDVGCGDLGDLLLDDGGPQVAQQHVEPAQREALADREMRQRRLLVLPPRALAGQEYLLLSPVPLRR